MKCVEQHVALYYNNVNNVANFQIKQESSSRKIRRRMRGKAALQDLFVATNRACPKLSCPGVT